jgi:hypothetical protein
LNWIARSRVIRRSIFIKIMGDYHCQFILGVGSEVSRRWYLGLWFGLCTKIVTALSVMLQYHSRRKFVSDWPTWYVTLGSKMLRETFPPHHRDSCKRDHYFRVKIELAGAKNGQKIRLHRKIKMARGKLRWLNTITPRTHLPTTHLPARIYGLFCGNKNYSRHERILQGLHRNQ